MGSLIGIIKAVKIALYTSVGIVICFVALKYELVLYCTPYECDDLIIMMASINKIICILASHST